MVFLKALQLCFISIFDNSVADYSSKERKVTGNSSYRRSRDYSQGL